MHTIFSDVNSSELMNQANPDSSITVECIVVLEKPVCICRLFDPEVRTGTVEGHLCFDVISPQFVWLHLRCCWKTLPVGKPVVIQVCGNGQPVQQVINRLSRFTPMVDMEQA